MTEKRVVCLNCIDGRAQLPVIGWIKEKHGADYVDMITEPGVDGLLADSNNSIDEIKRKIGISIDKNQACMVFVVGHYDCKGNPVPESAHKEHICLGVERLQKELADIEIVGAWLNEKWTVEAL